MLNIFDFEKYKEDLISYYYYEGDNNLNSKEKRKKILETYYSDQFLLNIIQNTEIFILRFLERVIRSTSSYISFEISGEKKNIFTNCIGGWSPDTLVPIFSGEEEAYISRRLLKEFLGKNFRVEFNLDYEEIVDDIDEDIVIGEINYIPKLTIVGDFSLLKEKYEILKEQDFSRVLKK